MPTGTETFQELSGATLIPAGEQAPIGVLDLLLLIAARKRLILGAALFGAALFAGLGLVLPRLYTATAVILPPHQQHSTTGALMGQLGALAGVGATDLTLKTPAEFYIGILGSRTIADALIARFQLAQIYGTKRRSDTVKKLAGRTHLSTGKDTLIRIAVDDADPKRSAAIANAYVDEISVATGRLATTEAGQRRLFFEGQLAQERTALSQAEANLQKVQERTGVIELTGQTEVLIRAIAELRAEIAGREVALDNLRSGATSQNPDVQRRQAELASLRAHLRELQESEAKSRRSNQVTSSSQLPGAGFQYLQGLRELKYHESLFEVLSKEFEAAKIDESKDAPLIQVVDRATVPDKRNGLSAPVLGAIGFVAFATLAGFLVFLSHSIGGPRRSAKLSLIAQALVR